MTVVDLSALLCEWQVVLFMLLLTTRFPANQHGPTHDMNLLAQIAAQVTIVWSVMPTIAETPTGCHACSAFPAPDPTSATSKTHKLCLTKLLCQHLTCRFAICDESWQHQMVCTMWP